MDLWKVQFLKVANFQGNRIFVWFAAKHETYAKKEYGLGPLRQPYLPVSGAVDFCISALLGSCHDSQIRSDVQIAQYAFRNETCLDLV